MEMEEDDSMEIDETIPATPIIERSSEEISPNNSLTEKKAVANTNNIDAVRSPPAQNIENKEKISVRESETISSTDSNKKKETKSSDKQVDVVILDDDEDEPMKTVQGIYYKLLINKCSN